MFSLLPVLDQIEALYLLPRNKGRFDAYLDLLQGETKNDMVLPIAGFNPMAKDFVLKKVEELKSLSAEELMKEVLHSINSETKSKALPEFKVALNLSDDIGGAWSNRFTVEFSSKFEIDDIFKRNFCTPIFWSSEDYSEELIIHRTRAYVFRTLFWVEHGKPNNLKNHVLQEAYVQTKTPSNPDYGMIDMDTSKAFFDKYSETEDYSVLFNFFFGDEASEVLNYPKYGSMKNEGFIFSAYAAQNPSVMGINSDFSFE